jgi:hypothetical protein
LCSDCPGQGFHVLAHAVAPKKPKCLHSWRLLRSRSATGRTLMRTVPPIVLICPCRCMSA